MRRTPNTPAGTDLRNDVITAFEAGDVTARLPSPAWHMRTGDDSRTTTLIGILEVHMTDDLIAEIVKIVAQAARSADPVLSLPAKALIAKVAAHHGWEHEDDIEVEGAADEIAEERRDADRFASACFPKQEVL